MNSETDFVARTDAFQELVDDVTTTILTFCKLSAELIFFFLHCCEYWHSTMRSLRRLIGFSFLVIFPPFLFSGFLLFNVRACRSLIPCLAAKDLPAGDLPVEQLGQLRFRDATIAEAIQSLSFKLGERLVLRRVRKVEYLL